MTFVDLPRPRTPGAIDQLATRVMRLQDSLAIAGAGVYTVPVLTTGAAVTGGTGTGATVTVGYGVGTVVVTSAGNTYTSAPTVGFSGGGGTSAAATATLAAVATTTADFCRILPLADCVVTEFTPFTRVNGKSYSAQSIVNRTLKASVPYDIFGKTIKFSSGHAILFLR